MHPEPPSSETGLDAAPPAFAHRMFDLARDGHGEELAAHVDAGLPVDLTDDEGGPLLPDKLRLLERRS